MTERKQLIKDCDNLFSDLVTFGKVCENCGDNHKLDPCHIIGRTELILRWSFDNVFCLCRACHRFFHDNPSVFKSFVVEQRGSEVYERLVATPFVKMSNEDLKNIKKKLEEEVLCLN